MHKMLTAEALKEELGRGREWRDASLPDYDDLVRQFAHIFFTVSDGDYQGDHFYVVTSWGKLSTGKNGIRYGFLVVGYGSCSGCDSLQACDSWEELAELAQRIHSDVRWFDSLPLLVAFLEDREGRAPGQFWRADAYGSRVIQAVCKAFLATPEYIHGEP